MSDAKDAAHNAAQTADLIREEKAGINEVKEAAYVNYNAGYVCTYIMCVCVCINIYYTYRIYMLNTRAYIHIVYIC